MAFPQNRLTLQGMEEDMVAYCVSLNNVLKTLVPRVKASLPNQSGGTEHCLRPGEFLGVKGYRRKSWKDPHWRGPYQILLTNPTAVKVTERDTWIHVLHCRQIPATEEDGGSPIL